MVVQGEGGGRRASSQYGDSTMIFDGKISLRSLTGLFLLSVDQNEVKLMKVTSATAPFFDRVGEAQVQRSFPQVLELVSSLEMMDPRCRDNGQLKRRQSS